MTSSMTSQGGLKVGPLYSLIYKITTFFMITKQRAKISSLNFLCICIIRLWLQLYEYIFMTSFMTSPSHKIGQILKLIYLRQYLSYSVDQKLKMSEMLMAIFLVYSTSGISSGKKVLSGSKWRPFWKNWNIKHSFNLTSDMKRSSQIMPKKVFLWWWRHPWRHRVASNFLYIFMFRRLAPGANCNGNVLSKNANIVIVFLGYTCQKTISMNYTFRDCRSRSTSQAYWVTLALISNIANYLKYNYFLDCDGIDNVTLRLWKFSDFCSRHTVGVAGDDIMFHILVALCFSLAWSCW